MAEYYVNNNAQANGDHEVHEAGCSYMPSDRKHLGNFSNCRDAVTEAKRTWRQSNGCYWCSRACHTT
jgi:hypothetical protein